jgi:hypothetical protein
MKLDAPPFSLYGKRCEFAESEYSRAMGAFVVTESIDKPIRNSCEELLLGLVHAEVDIIASKT